METTRDIATPQPGADRAPALEAALAAVAADNEALAAQLRDMAESEAAHLERIRELEREVAKLREMCAAQAAARFGRKSESLPQGQLMMELFNEAEALAGPGAPDPLAQEPARPARPRKRGGRRPTDLSALPVEEVVEHRLDDRSCPACGEAMSEMGYDTVREVVHVPARLYVREHRVYRYVCQACSVANRSDGGETPAVLARAQGPALPLPKSAASASLLAEVIHQKFALSVPVHRLAADLSARAGLPFTRQAVGGWVLAVHSRWLSLLRDAVARELARCDVLACDETPVTITHAPGRAKGSSSKSYIWILSAPAAARPACLFAVGPTRSGSVAARLLAGWEGTLVTDGYGGYDCLPAGVRRSSCLAHVRRGFYEVVKAQGGPERAALTSDGRICGQALLRIAAIYRADEPEEGEADGGLARRARVAKLLDALISWCRETEPLARPGLKTAKALAYALGQLPRLRECCLDPRVPLDNNGSERLAKAYKVGAKNWQLCDTVAGAEASACMYTLVETAKANGVEPRSWLEWVLTEMPRLGEPQALTHEQVESFLPWSDAVPERCRTRRGADFKAGSKPSQDAD